MTKTADRTHRSPALERIQPKPTEAPCRMGETRAVQAALRGIRFEPFAAAGHPARADAPFICG